jgi:hypothetical protein
MYLPHMEFALHIEDISLVAILVLEGAVSLIFRFVELKRQMHCLFLDLASVYFPLFIDFNSNHFYSNMSYTASCDVHHALHQEIFGVSC